MPRAHHRTPEPAFDGAQAAWCGFHTTKASRAADTPDSVFLAAIRAEAPADKQALITDLFEKITIYDLKAKEAKTVKAANGLWQTSITVEAAKYYADAKGNEKAAPLGESIEVGLFGGRPGIGAFGKKDVVMIERKPVKNGVQTIIVTSKTKPKFAGVDPYNFYIDRDSDDNLVPVS